MVDLPPEFDARTLAGARVMIARLLERIGDLEDRLGSADNGEAEKSKSQIAHETEVSRRRVVAFSQDRQRRVPSLVTSWATIRWRLMSTAA